LPRNSLCLAQETKLRERMRTCYNMKTIIVAIVMMVAEVGKETCSRKASGEPIEGA